MYAVIKTGGKQYKVAKDQIVVVEKLAGEAGAAVAFEEVLLLGGAEATTVGAPLVAGATVTAEIVEQGRGPKIIVFKKKRRKNHRRRNGHRQHQTVLRITDILTGGKKPAMAKAVEPKAEPEPSSETTSPKWAIWGYSMGGTSNCRPRPRTSTWPREMLSEETPPSDETTTGR